MSDALSGANRIEVQPDAAALATAVAGDLLAKIAGIQADGRVAAVGLTGGAIADAVHAEVARLAEGSGVDWSRVDVWWGDERFVPADSPDRNAGQARRILLDHLPLDPGRVHEMPDASFGSIEDAARAYDEEMRTQGTGRLDVLMLGVGPDGHVASLFPRSPLLEVDDRVAVAVTDSPKPPPQRISLTMSSLNRATDVWFLVSGAGKAEAVAAALGGADPREIPAAGVSGRVETIWWLDQAAASRL